MRSLRHSRQSSRASAPLSDLAGGESGIVDVVERGSSAALRVGRIGLIGIEAELRQVVLLARQAWANGRRPWLAVATASAAIAVAELLHSPTIAPALQRSGDVYASLPLPEELMRLPMSLLLPTPLLPLWGAVLQLLVVLALSELLLGRRLTVAVAGVGHVASTLAARAMIEVCSGYTFCLPAALAHAVDSGPSAAVTSVGACLLISVGCKRCAVVLSGALLVAAVALPGLDGAEHLVALLCGFTAGAVCRQIAFGAATERSARLPARMSSTATSANDEDEERVRRSSTSSPTG